MIKLISSDRLPTYLGPGDGKTKVLIDGQAGAKNLSVARILFPVGGRTEPHTREVEECVYVIRGRTAVVAGDDRVEFGEGDAILIEAGTEHHHENIGTTELEQIVIFAPQGPEAGLKDLPT